MEQHGEPQQRGQPLRSRLHARGQGAQGFHEDVEADALEPVVVGHQDAQRSGRGRRRRCGRCGGRGHPGKRQCADRRRTGEVQEVQAADPR